MAALVMIGIFLKVSKQIMFYIWFPKTGLVKTQINKAICTTNKNKEKKGII